MPSYRTLDTAALKGKKVLLRAGFDIGIEKGVVTDTERVSALVPTMKYILDHGAALIIAAHEGRPRAKRNMEFSQKPIVPILEQLLGKKVQFAESCIGSAAEDAARALKTGEVLLLENLRFEQGEEGNDPAFAKALAGLADLYVNDAFTNCHRAHASMVGVPGLLPSYMGLQLAKEVQHLEPIVGDPRRPLTLIVSGAKMETKVPVIARFLEKGDDILLGGCIANTFIAARGFDVARSKVEKEYLEQAQMMMLEADKVEKATIHVPRDVVVASSPEASSQAIDIPVEDIEGDMAIFDIGTVSVGRYCDIIRASATVVWNGPLGYYEAEPFAGASKRVAEALAEATAGGAVTIIGGGDTIDFHTRYGLPLDRYTFVSTGGGAMLEFISGRELPALTALRA